MGGMGTYLSQFFSALLVVCASFRILREPAAENPHLLGEDLMDAPEAGEGSCPDDG